MVQCTNSFSERFACRMYARTRNVQKWSNYFGGDHRATIRPQSELGWADRDNALVTFQANDKIVLFKFNLGPDRNTNPTRYVSKYILCDEMRKFPELRVEMWHKRIGIYSDQAAIRAPQLTLRVNLPCSVSHNGFRCEYPASVACVVCGCDHNCLNAICAEHSILTCVGCKAGPMCSACADPENHHCLIGIKVHVPTEGWSHKILSEEFHCRLDTRIPEVVFENFVQENGTTSEKLTLLRAIMTGFTDFDDDDLVPAPTHRTQEAHVTAQLLHVLRLTDRRRKYIHLITDDSRFDNLGRKWHRIRSNVSDRIQNVVEPAKCWPEAPEHCRYVPTDGEWPLVSSALMDLVHYSPRAAMFDMETTKIHRLEEYMQALGDNKKWNEMLQLRSTRYSR